MKCLSLTAPYGTLIAIAEKHPELGKRIETRSWATSYRGPLAIHQAKGKGGFGSFKAIRDLCGTRPFFDALMHIVPNYDDYCDRDAIFELLPAGAIVATCELLMRPAGDYRPDQIVKRELYDAHIAGRYDVLFCVDDRNSVVAMWRALGLTCLQCAEGDF